MHFGDYLKHLRHTRKPKKLAQDAIGQIIGTTRQYIDAIEKRKKGAYPPNFELCEKIADKLSLTQAEKDKLIWLAFKERLKKDWSFYHYFQNQAGSNSESDTVDFQKVQGIEYYLRYAISWNFSPSIQSVSTDVREFVRQLIEAQSLDTGFQIKSLTIDGNQVELDVMLDSTTQIQDFVTGLKSALTGPVKTHFPQLSETTKQIWDDGFRISTVGKLKSIVATTPKTESVKTATPVLGFSLK